MPVIQIATPFNIDIEFELAEFHKRLLAYLLDFFLLFVYLLSMLYFLFGAFELGDESTGFVILVLVVPPLFYSLITELLFGGQTAGKKMMGIKVTSLAGGEPTLGQYLLRWFMRFYEWGFILFFLFWGSGFVGFAILFAGSILATMFILLTAKSQRIGDIVAGTVVINTQSKLTVNDTIFTHIAEDNYKVMFPEVMRLSDRDINTVKNVLLQAQKSRNYDMLNRVAFKVQDVLKVSSDMYAEEFLDKILQDYNYLATREK
jgi:uncharacterized RDD family membrane protein YckC